MTSRGSIAGVRRVARIDLTALRDNLVRLLDSGDSWVLDARADAYGHGAATIIPLALETGIRTILVSDRDAAVDGVPASAVTNDALSDGVTAAAAYGVDGISRPVMTLTGEVVAVKAAESGAGVSYGYSYRTPAPTTLALVALGYADGIPRLASNRAGVFVGGSVRPLVGRVAMDQFVVDLGEEVTAVTVGDEVVLFGNGAAAHPLVTDWAEWTGRRALELTANLGARIARVAHG